MSMQTRLAGKVAVVTGGGDGSVDILVGNHRVRISGDEAQTFTYARVHHVGAGPTAGLLAVASSLAPACTSL